VAGDPQWREHTTLALLTDNEVAWFSREVTAKKFALKPAVAEKADAGASPASPAGKP
jgi:hypothetical protein